MSGSSRCIADVRNHDPWRRYYQLTTDGHGSRVVFGRATCLRSTASSISRRAPIDQRPDHAAILPGNPPPGHRCR
jgi:hypothetical protein